MEKENQDSEGCRELGEGLQDLVGRTWPGHPEAAAWDQGKGMGGEHMLGRGHEEGGRHQWMSWPPCASVSPFTIGHLHG